MSKNNFLLKQFRAAGKLVYEWQDTVGTIGLGIGAFAGSHYYGTEAAILLCMYAATFREVGRIMFWEEGGGLRLVNDLSSSPRLDRLPFAAATVALGLAEIALYMTPYQAFSNLFPKYGVISLGLLSGSMTYLMAGGVRGIKQSYGYMWDWPRKNGGGGTTQTQIVKDNAKALWRSAKDRIRPTRPPKPGVFPPALPQPA